MYSGKGKELKRIIVERLVTQMVVRGYIEEKSEINGMGYSWTYLIYKKNIEKFEMYDSEEFVIPKNSSKEQNSSKEKSNNEDVNIQKGDIKKITKNSTKKKVLIKRINRFKK